MMERDPALIEKSAQLRLTPLFINPSDDYPLIEKQFLFLVLAGLKPVAGACSGHWEATAGGRHTVADKPNEVGAFLKSLGLHYSLEDHGHMTLAMVSLRPELIQQIAEARSDEEKGRLYGYPETAIQAFVQGKAALLPQEEQKRVEAQAGIMPTGAQFRLSKAHWQEELVIVRQWHETLRDYGLDLFKPVPSEPDR